MSTSSADSKIDASTEAVVAGFEFKLEGAVATDLTVKDSKDAITSGTKVETYIAKNLCTSFDIAQGQTATLEIKYLGTNTENKDAVINSYDAGTGKLVFTVYHFSRYAIISKVAEAVDNTGKMYVVEDNGKAGSALKTALNAMNSDNEDKIKTITLLKNINVDTSIEAVSFGKEVSLDLNGKTLTWGTETEKKVTVAENGALTVSGVAEKQVAFVKGAKVGGSGLNGTYYSGIKTALDALEKVDSEYTITIYEDEKLTSEITNKNKVTVDLNTKTIEFDGKSMTTAITNEANGDLTLSNGCIVYKDARNLVESNKPKQYSTIVNKGTLNTSDLSITVNVAADCIAPLNPNDFNSAINDDNSCPGVFIVRNEGTATFDNSKLTLTVNLENEDTGLISNKKTTFAGVKPIIIYQGEGATTTIRNKSNLTASTTVPGGVLGLYVEVTDTDTTVKTIATIKDSTISVSNGCLGWGRPVFADGRDNDKQIEITIEDSTIESTYNADSTMKGNAYFDSLKSNNRIYGLRAKGNSVIEFDSGTTVTVEDTAETNAVLYQYATDVEDHTGSAKDANKCGQIIQTGTEKTWYVNTKEGLTTAVENADSSATVKLVDDINLANTNNFVINGGKKFKIDMNGKTLTVKKRIWIQNADVELIGTGTLETSKTGDKYDDCSVIWLYGSEDDPKAEDYTVLTAGSGITIVGEMGISVNNTKSTQNVGSYGVKVNLTGTEIKTDFCGLYIQGYCNLTDGNVPVFDLTDISIEQKKTSTDPDDDCVGIYGAGYAVWNINGDKTQINGVDSAIEIRAGKLNINAGTFKSSANAATDSSNGNGTTTKGAAVAVAQHTTKLPIEVTISGGKFEGYHALSVLNPEKKNADTSKQPTQEDCKKVSVKVVGGTFTATSSTVSNIDTDYFVTSGEISQASKNNPYTVEGKNN